MLEEFDSEDINELEKDTRANRENPGYSYEQLINIKRIQARYKQKIQRRRYLQDVFLMTKIQARVKGMLERRRYAKAKQSIIRM
jgi:hypothetical protein